MDEDSEDDLTAQITGYPAKGSLGFMDQSTGNVTYTPLSNQSGKDAFVYRINDGKANSNEATVGIDIIK